jgi:hypothetical protein
MENGSWARAVLGKVEEVTADVVVVMEVGGGGGGGGGGDGARAAQVLNSSAQL